MRTPAPISALVVGGSAGGLDAVSILLAALPADVHVPIVVVLHVSPTSPSYLAELLARHARREVREACDKEPIAPSVVYVAPPAYHLLIEDTKSFALSVDEPVWFSRPSIDVLFESAADAYGAGLAGVLLTGANEDGARGLAAIGRAGGHTLVQDPATAVARAMPDAAIRLRQPDHVLSLPALAQELSPLLRGASAGKDVT